MFRIVTRQIDHRGNQVFETGPWMVSRNDAEDWADILRRLGYSVRVECLARAPADKHDDLSETPASLA